MSDYYYLVDLVRPDGKAGDVHYVRAASLKAALEVTRRERPSMVDWNATAHRIKREEFPTGPDYEVIVLPTLTEFIPEADADDPSDGHDRAWNAYCTALTRDRLLEKRAAGEQPRLLTQYLFDTVEEGNDSRDLVTLDHRDGVVVIDTGVR